MARVTLQTVADRVGVSRMTVSNAFSRPDQLSDELRKKILAAAEELGYWGPDPAGRALARGRAGAVGVMLTDNLQYAFTDQFATDLMASIAAELAPTGMALTLLTSETPSESVPARDVPLDGAIVFSCSDSSTSVDWLRRRKLPIVFIDQEPTADATCVNIDEQGGAAAAAEHLIALGHRRISIVTSYRYAPLGRMPLDALADGTYGSRSRTMGMVDTLAAHGITPVVINAARAVEAAGATAAEELLGGDPSERPTGVLCYSDTLAMGVLRTARRMGLDVPGDLSVVGFDDTRDAATTNPPLTTVHQDVAGKGHTAAALLTALIDAKGTPDESQPTRIVLPTRLVIRESSGPVPITAS